MEARIKSLSKSTLKQIGQLDTWLVLPPSPHAITFQLLIYFICVEEHHIGNFDPASFFTLHDFDSNGFWDHQEILKLYGAEDPDPAHAAMSQSKKDEIIREITKIMDTNNNDIIEREEFMAFVNDKKGTLPDFGTGPGHHWDIEMEYEIHHWEK